MKRIFYLFIINVSITSIVHCQVFDTTFTSTESGTITHTARNSITLGPGYSYTPSGGSLTLQIQNPVVNGTVTYSPTPVDPETRTLNTSTYLVGATNGSFNVTSIGGASYAIPLDLPPGVNGLAPTLSIEYSSNNREDVVGYGWQIGGLSLISRGPQTIYHDGIAGGVDQDLNDRFYVDGQRLVNTTSYDYGNANAKYQTDDDVFTRFTPQNVDSNGPGWFKAETKSGLIYEYGKTAGSKLKITGHEQVLKWHISKIYDRNGNQINISYLQDYFTLYPAQITYGPNLITFYYKERQDVINSFVNDVKVGQRLLLDKIIIKYNSSAIKTYEFKYTYQGNNYNSYSNLNEIIEYGIGTDRYNSTAITYQIPDNVAIPQPYENTTHPYVNYKSRMCPGDFNGDGQTDFLCLPDASKGATWTGLRVCLSNGDGSFSTGLSETTTINLSLLRDIRAVDLNGDGMDDILVELGSSPTSYTSYFYYMINDGTPFGNLTQFWNTYANPTAGYGMSSKVPRAMEKQEDDNELNFKGHKPLLTYPVHGKAVFQRLESVDYNGDGINDIFINGYYDRWFIFSFVNSSGQMTSSPNQLASGTLDGIGGEVISGDFNGDGKTDLWCFENDGLNIFTFDVASSSLELLYHNSTPTNKYFFTLDDFNADGKVDMFLYGYGKGGTEYSLSPWQLHLSKGSTFEQCLITPLKYNLKDDYIRLGDFDGDGTPDLMVRPSDQSWSGLYIYLNKNKGTDFYSYSLQNYPYYSNNYYLGDYNGDGHTDFICTDGVSPWWAGYKVYKTTGKTSILLEKVGNGLGYLTKLSYTKLSETAFNIYQRGTGATYPVSDFQGPWTVVRTVKSDNGKGSMDSTTYWYEGIKIHIQGKGFLGYTKTKASNYSTNIANETSMSFNSIYYYPTEVQSYTKFTWSADTIDKIRNIYSHTVKDAQKKWIFSFLQSSRQTNKLTGHVIITNNQFNDYGNPITTTKKYSNGPTETITNAYNDENLSLWLLGRPTATTLKYTSNTDTIIRSGIRDFSDNSNQLLSETWYSGTNNQVTRTINYTPNGSIKKELITANSKSRATKYSYYSDSIRIATVIDPLLRKTSNNYDSYGRLSTEQSYLNQTLINTLTYSYDNLNRVHILSSTYGNVDTTTYKWESPTGQPKLARYSIRKSKNDGSMVKLWYDRLGREIRADNKGFDGTMIYNVTKYNLKGQVDSISDPYYSTGNALWNRYVYDYYGRETNLYRPSGRNTTWTYINNTITETTAGKSFSRTLASDGTLTSATDAGGTITYTYYPDGKTKAIQAPGTIITKMKYDIAGNQIQLIDPSADTINYTYNGFGELITQVNGRNQTTSISYNDNGTIHDKITAEGTTSYTYTANNQVNSISSPESVNRSFVYDTKGRDTSVTETVPGSTSFVSSFTYDDKGRLSTITHPSGIVETQNYNSSGYLSSISAGGSTRWTISAVNARQQITSGQYGSLSATFGFDNYGYPTSTVVGTKQDFSYNFNTTTGNLTWRQNNKGTGLKETFYYDNIERLDSVYKGTSAPVRTLKMTYDSYKAGITSKSDVGNLFYNRPGKPYAISHIYPTTGLTPSTTQTLTYSSFESIRTISENNYSASFIYNADDERAKMEIKQGVNTILTRWYPSNRYIKETAGGVTKEYTFIGGDAYTAPVVAIKQSGTTTYYNLLRDHLGSINYVIRASDNYTIAEYSYDAWGRMRNTTTWENYAPGSEPALFVAGRGFTSHEHLPWFNLINMNGRVYDPLIGQFLSPDRFIQNPAYTQNLNRYSYCYNNPLSNVDPTGNGVYRQNIITSLFFQRKGATYGSGVGGSGGSWSGNTGRPGSEGNGIGLNGVYFDWQTFTYRSVTTMNMVSGPIITTSDLLFFTYHLSSSQHDSFGIGGKPIYEKAILGGGPNSKFSSIDEAAMDFGLRYNDNSISRNKEFGTVIYSFEENGVIFYSYMVPIVGASENVFIPLGAPWLTTFLGFAHTHSLGSEDFSELDLYNTVYYNFLCTPSGALYRYSARDQSTLVITRDLPNFSNFQNYQWDERDYGQLNFWKQILWRFNNK